MNDVVHVLLGAGLVAIGVLAAALADRIRGLNIARDTATYAASTPLRPTSPAVKSARTPRAESMVRANTADGADDVIAALVAAGYKKQIARQATHACGPAERATPEDWARAALRGCASGGVS